MAFTASVTKQLRDLLQEQQEPFALEIYLIDKGYPRNMLISKRSTSNNFFKRRKIVSSCSNAVKALFNKFEFLKVKRGGSGSQKSTEDTFLSDRRKTRIESCTDSDMEDNYVFLGKGEHRHGNLLGEEEADTDIKIKKISEDRTQLSPVSVLEATVSNEDSPIHNRQNLKTMQEEVSSNSIYSYSCNSIENSLSGKTSGDNDLDSYSHYKKIKSALQQTKQLVFDCVKEIVETQRLKNRRQQHQFREPIGAEAIGKILCENILAWSIHQPVHATYSNQLLDIDLLGTAEEWTEFEQQRKGISMDIADNILEDISSDIVMDMTKV